MDGSILYLAMPHITSALRPTADQALWILDIYGFVVGPLIGGMLLRRFEWGIVFLINLPVALAFSIAAPILLREVRSTTYGRIDLPSLALSFIGILLFTWSIKAAAAEGFTAMPSAIYPASICKRCSASTCSRPRCSPCLERSR